MGAGEVVDVEESVEVFEFVFLDILGYFESAGVPLATMSGTMVRLTMRLWLILIFLNLSWNPLVGSISSLNLSF